MLRRLVISVLTFLFLAMPVLSSAGEIVDRIVAVVNGQPISLSEVDEKLDMYLASSGASMDIYSDINGMDKLRKQILDSMINDILLQDKAESMLIDVSIIEVESSINKFKDESGLSEDQFVEKLNSEGMTRSEYEESIKKNIMKSRLLAVMVHKKAMVTEAEAKAYFDSHKNELGSSGSGEGKIWVIVVPADKDIVSIKSKIDSGELSFEQAAKEYSVGPGAAEGGYLGELDLADLNAGFREVLQSLASGQVSAPFSMDGQSALAKIEKQGDAVSESDVDFATVKDDLMQMLEQQKAEKVYTDYMKKLRKEAVVDIRF